MIKMGKKFYNYKIFNEFLNCVTHGFGLILSILGLLALCNKAENLHSNIHYIAYLIFGISQILLFLSSTIYHSLTFTKLKKTFQIIDHSSIYILIAGSYTPYCLLAIRGTLGWFLFSLIWMCAFTGIIYKNVTMVRDKKIPKNSMVTYILMGAFAILIIYPLYQTIGNTGLFLLAFGGLLYFVGTYFYKSKKIRFSHPIWHVFVMLGATYIYFSIFLTT